MALLQVEYRAPKLRGLGLSSLISGAQRSSMREYWLSSISSSLSDKFPRIGELQYGKTRVSMQMISEHRIDVIIKAGDCIAFLIERVIGLPLVSNVSTSMVILYSLPPDSKVNVEDPLENATGLDLSSLPVRKWCNLFTWYSATPSFAIKSSNSKSLRFSLSKIYTPPVLRSDLRQPLIYSLFQNILVDRMLSL